MLIRPMVPDDSSQVAMIHMLSWQHAYRGIVDQEVLDSLDIGLSEKNWKKGIESNEPPIKRLVLESEGKVAGYLCGLENRFRSQLPDCDSEVWAIYVHPDQTGNGFGKALLKAFALDLRSLGKTRLCVWVLKENHGARRFYEKQGGKLSEANKVFRIGEQTLDEAAYEFELLRGA
jgi:ribosomal protein S18 acetylase RimI-like enzyme